VHPTCGILRDLQAFFWLRVFSTPQALSTPTHTRVTQTVGQPRAKSKYIFVSLKREFSKTYSFFSVAVSIHKNIFPLSLAVVLFKLAFLGLYFSASKFSSSRLFRLAAFSSLA
jgi:hypothetical protein